MTAAAPFARPALLRPRRMLLGGVCAATARHLGWPPPMVRLVAVVLALLGGAGILLYLWLWALVPLEDAEAPRVQRVLPGAAILAGLAGVAAATGVVLARSGGAAPTGLVPGILESALLAAAAVGWSLVLDRDDTHYERRYQRVVRTVAGALLVIEGALLLPFQANPVTAVLGLLVAVIGVVILIVPRVVGLWSDLMAERSARDREAQRAEIAAHLHDSVLQTLAIIQHRAGPQSEVARLARAQERELRDWLFAGTDPFAGDVATELRTIAAELELEHPARFEVVTVGDVAGVRNAALVGAAREAMLNAARHAGGDIAVYVEATDAAAEVFVRDRGRGFDPDAVPDGRIGVRESIIGRMERAGGRAELRSGAAGTEVHLRMPIGAAS
jgi:signal transduction histidine kinase/phage shock protein PspC (stress-responsive transcriptional regulator)